MDQSSSAPFPPGLFLDSFTSMPKSSPKTNFSMNYAQCQSQLKMDHTKEDMTLLPASPTHPSRSQFYDTEPKQFGNPCSTHHSTSIIDRIPNLTTLKLSEEVPSTRLIPQHPPREAIVKGESKLVSCDIHKLPVNDPAQLYFTQHNFNQYVLKSSKSLVAESFRSSGHSTPSRITEPLPNIFSIQPKQDIRDASSDHFSPPAELLLHLHRSSAPSHAPISSVPISLPPSHPAEPGAQVKRTTQPPRPCSAPPTPHSIAPIPHHRPRRANDYTGEFKREFCALLSKHADARAQWEHFWRRRECTGRRPCIKSYLAFCEMYPEFGKLRRIHKYRVLGTRTNCECSFPAHSTQTPAVRFTASF